MSVFLLLSAAWAQDAVSLELVQRAQQGIGLPRVSVLANVDTVQLSMSLSCGGLPVSASGAPKAGERLDMDIPLNGPRTAHCSGELSVRLGDGSEGKMPLAFDVELLAPLEISVDRDSVNLENGTLSLSLSRPAAQVTIMATGVDGEVGSGDARGVSGGEPVQLSWSQDAGAEVLRLRVRAEDADGFWSAVELFPWYYAIPHEDVVFESNQSTIRSSESSKLDDAMAEISAVQDKYGQHAQINLYVAGYTDTVGSAASNQGLSERRARAIASWFQGAGFSGNIYYQGFGENGQLVYTADGVDEARNRRAAYIVAAEAPPSSPQLPGSHWIAL